MLLPKGTCGVSTHSVFTAACMVVLPDSNAHQSVSNAAVGDASALLTPLSPATTDAVLISFMSSRLHSARASTCCVRPRRSYSESTGGGRSTCGGGKFSYAEGAMMSLSNSRYACSSTCSAVDHRQCIPNGSECVQCEAETVWFSSHSGSRS